MRGFFSGFIVALTAVAFGQGGVAPSNEGNFVPVLAGVLVLAILVLGFLVLRKPKAALPPPEIARGEDEVTQVRIQGPRLVRIQGGVKVGADVPVNGPVVVGSDPSCTIHFEDSGLSPRHAEFRPEAGGTVVVDRGSAAGTLVNDVPVTPETSHPLADGDKVRLGELVLQYRASA